MTRQTLKLGLGALALTALLAGGAWAWRDRQEACCEAPDTAEMATLPEPPKDRPRLGLMTSLPIYWPLGSDIATIASGEAQPPWQRRLLEQRYELVPLDTLSPIAGLSPDAPETDPLAGLDHLAIIQPRGLSPADNVALDEWVRAGGQLLLVLDPMLTGHYEAALGDPRRPTDAALIPPVVERWGLAVSYDPEQSQEVENVAYGNGTVMRSLAGEISLIEGAGGDCDIQAEGMLAQCRVGEGLVTLLADAATFEFASEALLDDKRESAAILTLPEFAFP